jgi:4-hydroxy-tetrahydrodipicolinate synthase
MHHPATTTPLFSGLWIPLVTPFDAADRVDHAALTRLVQRLRHQGVAGFVACGSTGEAAALSADEQLAVLDTVLAAADGLPVLMGLSGYRLPSVLQALQHACQRPIAGVLVAAPCYVRPAQDGLLLWFRSIADASTVPVVLYDIPYRTGVSITLDTLMALAAHPRIQALKDCGGDAAKTAALVADGRLAVLAGEDAQVFSAVAQGAAGAITATAHLHTERFARVIALLRAGELHAAQALWQPLQPWVQTLFEAPNPGPLKALLAMQGEGLATLRPPLTAPAAELVQRALALQAAGLSPR